MRKTSFVIGAGSALVLSLWMGSAVLADDAAGTAKAPMTGSTKPNLGKGPAEEKSLPSSAAPATTTSTTAATNQDKTVKAMNKDAKAKVETEGK